MDSERIERASRKNTFLTSPSKIIDQSEEPLAEAAVEEKKRSSTKVRKRFSYLNVDINKDDVVTGGQSQTQTFLSPFIRQEVPKAYDAGFAEKRKRLSIVRKDDSLNTGTKVKEEEVAWEDVFSDFIKVEKKTDFDYKNYRKDGKPIPAYLKDELVIQDPLSFQVYNGYVSNKGFKEYFSDYLNGRLNAKQIIERNNFPNIFKGIYNRISV